MATPPSSSFELLDERIRRWIWAEGWSELREAQERAIPAIVTGDHDVIVAAATAAGKTEAAMLPVLTNLLYDEGAEGLVLYVSPLKALINDQFGRLEPLCELLDIPVWPWHGDITASSKTRFLKCPRGVLLITPESLEAMLCNRGFSAPKIFAKLRYIIIDELHAFIGSERGKQLQSLMHRIELAAGSKKARIGLSATLGDMSLAAEFLRPGGAGEVDSIVSKSEGGTLKLLLKGYVSLAPKPCALLGAGAGEGEGDTRGARQGESGEDSEASVVRSIASHMFQTLKGSNNLVFPNSRAKVEMYAHQLQTMCAEQRIPNEFWPHHGSLARELREETEAALKRKDRYATAVCTNTLELGIDIGAVKSIAQIGPPPSVASLRQRLGRSGRRPGEPSILRGYAIEDEINANSDFRTLLREELFEFSAMTCLLLEGWVEPPRSQGLHLSTLVQQLLSLIAQRGGVTASAAYRTLCASGPFDTVSKMDFILLLSHLGEKEILQQDSSGVLLHGAKGAILVNHYSFYASFNAEEEFRIIAGTRVLGSVPISSALSVGDFILFAASTWRVDEVDEASKAIYVTHHGAGSPPRFNGGSGLVHDKVRQRMKALYEGREVLHFLDPTAQQLIEEGRATYLRYELAHQPLIHFDGNSLLLTWQGDTLNEAIAMFLRMQGIPVSRYGAILEIDRLSADRPRILKVLSDLVIMVTPSPEILLANAFNLCQEKWDWTLPASLLQASFASLKLDIAGAHEWIKSTWTNSSIR
jgi:ATP-dependent Lhr-like helicase